METDPRHRYGGVDWEEVTARLSVAAIFLFHRTGLYATDGKDVVLKGVGMSPEDLVHQTIARVLDDRIKYRKNRGPLLPFLMTAMKNDFKDLLRHKAHRTTVIVEPVHTPGSPDAGSPEKALDDFEVSSKPPPDVLFRDYVYATVADEPELVEYAEAFFELELRAPRDIADALSTDVADIENRRKRLRRRLGRFIPTDRT